MSNGLVAQIDLKIIEYIRNDVFGDGFRRNIPHCMTAQHGVIVSKQQGNTRIDILLERFTQKQLRVLRLPADFSLLTSISPMCGLLRSVCCVS